MALELACFLEHARGVRGTAGDQERNCFAPQNTAWKRPTMKRGNARVQAQARVAPLLELSFSIYFLLAFLYAIRMHMWGTVPFLSCSSLALARWE